MPSLSIEQAFQMAVHCQHRGDLPQAESILRQILKYQPDLPEALNLLGVTLHQLSKRDEAIDAIRRAIRIDTLRSEFHVNLAVVLEDRGELDLAIEACSAAIELSPELA